MRNNSVNFNYAPLGDEFVVRALLENWSKLDPRVTHTNFDEDALATFFDLESLIERSGLSRTQRLAINGIKQGMTPQGVGDAYGKSRQAIGVYYRRAVNKITETAKREWSQFHGQ